MDFGQTLLEAQKNQQQKSNSSHAYYKTKFEPPKKEVQARPKDRLSANIQKFLQKREEEEHQKQLETKKKRDELLAMRDPKATKKIQKMLKVIKSANKSAIEDAVDHDNTAVTRDGPQQPDEDDYGYVSQESAAFYQKMMEKYSKMPEEEKFPTKVVREKKDLEGTRERMKQALKQEDEPTGQHKRRRRSHHEKDESPPPKPLEPEKKPEKPKIRKPAPPPMDFNQLLKLAEQKKSEPFQLPVKKPVEVEPERPMTKRQRREMEQEQARREAKQLRDAAKSTAQHTQNKASREEKDRREVDRKPEPSFTRIPKLSDRNAPGSKIAKPSSSSSKYIERNKEREAQSTPTRPSDVTKQDVKKSIDLKSQNTYRIDKSSNDKKISKPSSEGHSKSSNGQQSHVNGQSSSKAVLKPTNGYNTDRPVGKLSEHSRQKLEMREKPNISKEKERLLAEKQRKLNGSVDRSDSRERQRIQEQRLKLENEKQRIQEQISKLDSKQSQSKQRPEERKSLPTSKSNPSKSASNSSKNSVNTKPSISNTFDFDRHVTSLGKSSTGQKAAAIKPGMKSDIRKTGQSPDIRKKQPPPKRRIVDSDSEYDSELDDFIDDGDDQEDYSKHIKEIFGYDKSKYQDVDEDDAAMESNFAQQQREEYISKKIGIMEDLEDMRMEAMEKKMKAKKRRRIDD